jgi:RAT1-interacting protein
MNYHSLNVKESSVSGKFPVYNRPSVIGYYSLDSERNYRGDLSQLKYIHFPTNRNVKFNLDDGRTHAVKKDDSCDEKINDLLRWMLRNSNGEDW